MMIGEEVNVRNGSAAGTSLLKMQVETVQESMQPERERDRLTFKLGRRLE